MTRVQITAADRIVIEGSTPELRFQLVDKFGAPITKASITAMTLDYVNVADYSAINSRTAQDVLDTNNVTLQADLTTSAATAANPVVITTTASHNLNTGDYVYITGVGGMTEINDRTFQIRRVSATKFSLQGEDGTSHTAYSSAGSVYTALVQWTLQALDTVITDTTTVSKGSVESHNAHFTWTYNSGLVGAEDIAIDVRRNY